MDDRLLFAAALAGFFGGVLGAIFTHYALPAWHRWVRARLRHCPCGRCRAYRGET